MERSFSCRKVVLGKKAHDEAMAKIESWKRGENKYSDKELWTARNIIESMEHPQTHQIINPIGRMSCFVPANIPIQCGMLLAAPTVCSGLKRLSLNRIVFIGLIRNHRYGGNGTLLKLFNALFW